MSKHSKKLDKSLIHSTKVTKGEIAMTLEAIKRLVDKDPEKAAMIFSDWLNKDLNEKKKTG